jgi:hypothetical protein
MRLDGRSAHTHAYMRSPVHNPMNMIVTRGPAFSLARRAASAKTLPSALSTGHLLRVSVKAHSRCQAEPLFTAIAASHSGLHSSSHARAKDDLRISIRPPCHHSLPRRTPCRANFGRAGASEVLHAQRISNLAPNSGPHRTNKSLTSSPKAQASTTGSQSHGVECKEVSTSHAGDSSIRLQPQDVRSILAKMHTACLNDLPDDMELIEQCTGEHLGMTVSCESVLRASGAFHLVGFSLWTPTPL